MDYVISYYSLDVETEILSLPETLTACYIGYTKRMMVVGPNLGEPRTKALGGGLFEMRLFGMEGIARVFFCTLVGKRIVMLHSFVKKTEKIPLRELVIARTRLKEVKREYP